MNKTFVVRFISPTEEFTINDVEYASIQTDDGIEGFLSNHQDDSYHLIDSKCYLKLKNEHKKYTHSAGHVRFENNELIISVLKVKKIN